VSIIYSKSMTLKYVGAGDKAAVTLMSTDIERITRSLPAFVEVFVALIEVSLAIWLLERQVSYAVIGPVGVVLVSSFLASRLGPPAGRKAKFWASVVQKRVAATNDYLGSIRAYRMAGLEAPVLSSLHALRVADVHAAVVSLLRQSCRVPN
jgi:ATP-binding cassette subfamily C (CFTR/MRP) protein 1